MTKPSAEGAAWRPVARPDVIFRQLADEWVLFDSEADKIHVLNLTAARVWLECDGTHTAAAIAAEVADDFESSPTTEVVTSDVSAALSEFVNQGLVS